MASCLISLEASYPSCGSALRRAGAGHRSMSAIKMPPATSSSCACRCPGHGFAASVAASGIAPNPSRPAASSACRSPPPPSRRRNSLPRSAPFGGGALEHHHMCNRKCQVWLEITKADGTVTRYSLKPLSADQVGADFVAGFQLLNRSESPSPIYHVRVSPSTTVSCTCPAFVWDKQRGQAKSTPPDQPPPTCKHCESVAGRRPASDRPRAAGRIANQTPRPGRADRQES